MNASWPRSPPCSTPCAGGAPRVAALVGRARHRQDAPAARARRARAAQRGFVVLAGRAAEFERELPFGVARRRARRPPRAARPDAACAAWTAERASRARRGLPRARGPGAGSRRARRRALPRAPRDPRAARAARRRPAPLLVALDDLHWADPASLELIAALLRRPPRARVLLAVAFRDGAGAGAAAARRSASRSATGCSTRVALGPLDPADAAARLLGAGEPRERPRGALPRQRRQPVLPRAARAAPRAGRTSRRRPAPGCRAPSRRRSPASSRRSARARASLLEGAAVAGEPFEPEVAAAAAGIEAAAALGHLDELLALGLVRATSVPRRFAFRHPIVRRAVYERRRRRLAAGRPRARRRGARRAAARPAGVARPPRRVLRRAAATRTRSPCSRRPRATPPRARRPPPRAGARRRSGCSPAAIRRAARRCSSSSPDAEGAAGRLEREPPRAARGAGARGRTSPPGASGW